MLRLRGSLWQHLPRSTHYRNDQEGNIFKPVTLSLSAADILRPDNSSLRDLFCAL